jgi:WD40 repeat protein
MRPTSLIATCLLLLGLVLAATPAAPPSGTETKEDAAVARFRERLAKKAERDRLRQEILGFVRQHAGTPAAMQAAALLGQLPSPLDRLDPRSIPELERFKWQPKELVAVLGEHRGRHGYPVTCVAYSKDGKLIVSGGSNGHVRLWDPATLRLKAVLGTGSPTQCLALARDNKTLAAGNIYGGLYIWDVSKDPPALTGTFNIGTSPVYSVSFRPDSKLLAAGVYDGLVHLIDTSEAKPKVRTQLAGHKTAVRAVCFAPNGKVLASASSDGHLRLWTILKDSVQEPQKVDGPKDVLALDYTPSGNTLAAAHADGTVQFWNVSGLRPAKRAQFQAHKSAINALVFAPGGATLVTAGADGSARIFDARTHKLRSVAEGHYGQVGGVVFSPTGRTLVTGGHDWTVRVWNVVGMKMPERFPLKGHWARANTVRFVPDGHTLGSGGEDRSARLWDLTKAAPAQTALFRNENTVINALAWSPDGKALALAGQNVTIRLWDVARRSQLRTFGAHPSWVGQMEYTTDGTRLVASSDKTFVLWNANTGREIFRFDKHEQRINSLSVSADGKYALTGTGYYEYDKAGKIIIKDGKYQYVDCTLRLWDLQRGEKLSEAAKLAAPVASVAFAPDGRRAACSLWNAQTHLWDVSPMGMKDTGAVKTTAPYTYLHVFSPDGRQLATAGNDSVLRVLDPATGKVTWQWTPGETLAAVTFSPDSRYLAVSIQTGPVYVIRLGGPPEPASK